MLKHGYIEGDDDDGDGDTAQLLSAEGLKGAIRHFQVCRKGGICLSLREIGWLQQHFQIPSIFQNLAIQDEEEEKNTNKRSKKNKNRKTLRHKVCIMGFAAENERKNIIGKP